MGSMKRVFPLLASAHLAFGQSTVVTCFDEKHSGGLPAIGIIPIADYQKATAEIERLRKELDQALKKKVQVEAVGAVVAEQKKVVQTLRNELRQAQRQEAGLLQDGGKDFATREKAMVARVNALESERAQASAKFQKRLEDLQLNFGRQEGEWQRKLLFVEGERDEARRQLKELADQRKQEQTAWTEAVESWRRDVETTVRKAMLNDAQEAVANTARLATDWAEERKGLKAQLLEMEAQHAQELAAWEQSVAEWQEKARKAVRTANVKQAQEAVANTARLAEAWQDERAQLQSQVKEVTSQLVKLEEQLGVQSADGKQAEVLRLGLAKKSKALQDLGTDAERLAAAWRKERRDTRRELAKLQSLYQTSKEGKTNQDQRVAQLEKALAEKDNVLEMLAIEADKLSASWTEQRGGLQKQIVTLEKKLVACEDKLAEASQKKENPNNVKLSQQIALVADLRTKFTKAKEQEDTLKKGLASLRTELDQRKDDIAIFQSEKEADAKKLTALQAELKQAKEHHAIAERDLAKVSRQLKASRLEVKELEIQSAELSKQLAETQEELKIARKQAAAENKKAQGDAAQKAAQVKKLQVQLGRLAVAQEELEGTLITTLGDYKSLQNSFGNLQGNHGGLQNSHGELTKSYEMLKGEQTELQASLETLGKTHSELQTSYQNLESNHQELQVSYQDLQGAHGELQGTYRDLEGTQTELKTSYETLQGSHGELETSYQELQGAHDELQNKHQSLQESHTQLESNYSELEGTRSALETSHGELQDSYQKLEGTYGQLQISHRELTTSRGELEVSLGQLKQELAGGGELAQEAIAARKAAEEELAKLQQKIEGQETMLEQARKRLLEAKKQKEAVENEAAAGKAALGKREAELQEARREMSALQLGQKTLVEEVEELRKRFVSIEPVRYQLASANVVAQQQRVLAEVKQVLEVYPDARFTIHGHTCNIGSEGANLKLSEDRALLLRDFLVKNEVPAERFTLVEGCGHTLPQASNETDEGRRQNRRVEIKVTREEQ